MLKKAYTPLSLLISGIALLLFGVLLLLKPAETVSFLFSVAGILLWVAALDALLRWLPHRKADKASLISVILYIGLAAVVTWLPDPIRLTVSLVFGVWILLNALAKYLYGAQLIWTRSRGATLTFTEATLYFLFAIAVLLHPMTNFGSLTVLLGIHCIVSGIFRLIDAAREMLGTDIGGKRVLQRVRIKPSVLWTALLPMKLARMLEDPDEQEEIARWTRTESVLKDPKPDLEIFFHLGKHVAMGMGHVDIALGDTVYAYGCYDDDSNRLFGVLSDGVLFSADRDAYVSFSVAHENKRLIGYGIVLTEEQKHAIQRRLAAFLEDCSDWQPQKPGEMMDMERDCTAKFHKIRKGPFQTYNVLTTNCVAVANILCGSGGVDLMNPQGIITPGTYCEFLDRQFRRPRSIVVSRTVYR